MTDDLKPCCKKAIRAVLQDILFIVRYRESHNSKEKYELDRYLRETEEKFDGVTK